jgi:hypothetical protein
LHFSGRNTQLLLKEYKNSLLKELEVEQNRTTEQKKNHDFIISKYEATWEQYKVYNLTNCVVQRLMCAAVPPLPHSSSRHGN